MGHAHLADHYIEDLREVFCKALWLYAVWNDGVQFVGSGGKTLATARAETLAGDNDGLIRASLGEEDGG